MISEVYFGDCMEFMKTKPDNFFSLAIPDPPFGLPADSVNGRGKLKTRALNTMDMEWDTAPSPEYFTELFRVSKNQCIWGGNYFALPRTRGICIWDKLQPFENFSAFEYCWTSFETPSKIFRLATTRTGEEKIHPTQKPVALYIWLLQKYAKPGDVIFDSHLGSGSSRIAADILGFDFYGCEKNKKYFTDQEKRFTEHVSLNKNDLFAESKKPEQEKLLL